MHIRCKEMTSSTMDWVDRYGRVHFQDTSSKAAAAAGLDTSDFPTGLPHNLRDFPSASAVMRSKCAREGTAVAALFL